MNSLNYNQSFADFGQNSFLPNDHNMERIAFGFGRPGFGHGRPGFGGPFFGGFGLPFLTGALIGSALAPNFYYGPPIFYPRPYPFYF